MKNYHWTLLRVVLCVALVAIAPLAAVHAAPCTVPDNGSGTVTLPPAGCAYLSPTDVHEITAGLPAGTTIVLTGIHHQFACGGAGTPPAGCSFVPSPACEQPGGTLGGSEECSDSTLGLNLQGTGTLAGFNRALQIPVTFETHVGPRTPGAPVQSFPTDMFRLQGQLPAGDPDFDLLRVTGGTDFGLPSPGHTTLTQVGTSFKVDSFFDITYRIDFIGKPGGHLGGMSGSTTGTIRMATGSGTPCVPASCDDGNPCTTDACDTTTGICNNVQISCDDGEICTDDFCNPATGLCSHAPTSCDDGNPCTVDNCSQALVAPQCLVPDNGGGTVTLPPAGCDYLSPSDVHEIVNGLPAGTTIQLGAIHRKFICGQSPASVCSFGPPIPGVDCDQPGGSLGGEQECAESELAMTLHGTGALGGWNRTVTLPLSFETHIGPRTPGNPTQSFDTQMFRLFGQITNPGSGDPDFDLLRITAGNDFGLPSPGHTTLRQQPGGNWAVDSFFDITYRIDFVGRPGGHLGGMSGSTTGTIRMQVGQGVGCTHTPVSCDDGNPCTDDACDPVMGCVHTNDDTNTCSDGNACTNDVCHGGVCECPSVTGACSATTQHYDAVAPEVPKAIPTTAPPNVITSSLTVAGAGPYLYDVNLKTFITHTSTGQLQITLKSPSGTVVSISTQNGSTNDNLFNGTLWDDDADPGNQVPYASPLAASALVTDTAYTNLVPKTTLAPEEPLGAFIGENPNGLWTLTIADVTNLDGGNLANWSLDVATLPAPPTSTTASFPSADVPKTITVAAPPQVVTSIVNVATAGTQIGRVRLTTNITHSWNNDLDFTLKSPSGTIVTIGTDNPVASSIANVFNGTLWSDKADPGNQVPYTVPSAASFMVTDTVMTTNVVETTLTPEEPFAAFIGENPNGTWTLTISDDANGDGGSLAGWSVEITTTTCTATLCAVDCNDNNPCTDDSCAPAAGCVHTPNANACSDGNLCTTGDVCSGGVCGGTPTNCDDGNVCTDDACIAATGACAHTNNTNACDDGNPCTTGDVCGTPPVALTQNFDGVVAPALPAGWVSTQTPAASNPWVTTTAFAASAPNSANTDTPVTVSDKTLDSPAFIAATGMAVDFDHRYNLEASTSNPAQGFDGAVLEIKIGAGAYQDIVTAGGSFVANGYTRTIDATFSSPIAGRPAWSGSTAGFIHTTANLPPAAAGQSVILRWRVASDSSLNATPPNGQWVDNIVVSVPVATCQPGAPTGCDDGNACTDDSCAQGLVGPNCTVTGSGGTVTLPPAGCDYLSPSDVHEIISGLPAGTTIEFGAIHRDFICRAGSAGGGCSFVPPPGTCEQPGGSLGGNEECSDSSLSLNLHGTGALTGWDRPLTLPVKFETHVAPRTPGNPVQSFDTQMFALQGQLPPGDPDFDLLRITAGNNFGMPSPGHTTLRFQGGGQWHVDSFFDITYRIDFVGHAGGHVGGMSGSTTGTIRMATGSGDPCVHTPHNCDDGNACTVDGCDPASGCFHTLVNCDDGQICTTDACVPATGLCTHSPISCDDGNACTADSCIQALQPNTPPCTVPDNGGGTVTLPPVGCNYLSPQDVHDIINGLPAGTTIQFGAIHKDFICGGHPGAPSICSFVPPPGTCDQPGGSLGGNEECSQSTLAVTLNGTGTLTGYNRTMQIPVEFETHVGPRTPGNPVQSFNTDMFKLQGQLPPGDPDFDLLRITAGTGFGMPSPGHTTLTQIPGGNFAVDSFFDITYRIDFVGHPGGPLGGMSGSTTATIRMQTGSGVGCVHTPITCNDSNPCTNDSCDSVSGCVFSNNTNACDDGNNCTAGDACSGGACTGTPITAPPETQGMLHAANKATINWTPAPFAAVYDVVRGDTALFPVGPGGGDEVCFDNLGGPTLNDPAAPLPTKGFWYLSRGQNTCGNGTYGTTHTGIPRVTTTCP